ncbi:uncharacterized protein DNG_01392 [Cephalotrichum gorgonifer]|uniref:Zinc finger PHD-type domain-containing protein n=1 Tax=Cephalotrichum gorgonifer TaxID=2041049 RepID=A0AAE8MSI6_9PEZI|nr:uncharacterized protein DNG_01392 [Cephalotrichum gorgonifer]
MQNDEGYGQQDFLGASQHADMAAFAIAQNDMFGYPMSAPVNTSPSFWDSSMAMSAMDLDFASHSAAASGVLFDTPAPSQQPTESYDWNASAALFHDPTTSSNIPPQPSNQENIQPASRKERLLAPRPSVTNSATQPVTSTAEPPTLSGTYPATADNGFVLSPGRGVDPGLLFSRPPSSDMNTHPFNPVSQPEIATASLASPPTLVPSNPASDSVKRSYSYKEPSRRGSREAASSPIKPTGPRAGLQRSFSENRGRRQLPVLAPAARPPAPQANGSGVASNRPQPRQAGRISPSRLHHRLSSLSSIPESSGGLRTRTSVKFTIDSRGRAHAETTVVVDEPGPSGIYRRDSRDSGSRSRIMESGSEDSDTDDEPIIIPSRNASFALPDPHKPVGSIFHNSGKKSPRMRSSFSFDDRNGRDRSHADDDESEAETVVNGGPGNGDATSELRKVVEDRQKRAANQRPSRFDSGGFTWAAGNIMSPTSVGDSSIPTPSTAPRHYRIRCVCHRNEPGGAIDAFMVQCEACELYLHGRCINITRRDMPPVYICAFCANTPNMRGGRLRDTALGGVGPSGHGHGHGSSPLSHKSFKSFR